MGSIKKHQIRIPAGTQPWSHELRVANILASAGYDVEFIATTPHKTADILLNGIEFEIKSPRTGKVNTLEHLVKRALRQSPNIIIDSSRTDGSKLNDTKIRNYLINFVHQHRQIKRLIFLTRKGKIIDIKKLI